VATSSFFDQARTEVGGYFDQLITYFGTQTVGQITDPIPIGLLNQNDPRVRRALAADPDRKLFGIENIMAVVPSSASWLLEKVFIPLHLSKDARRWIQ
jgi:hypothetical protein